MADPQNEILPSKLRVKFVITSLPVGGAEVLLYNLISRMDRDAFDVSVVCLKEAGAMGESFRQLCSVQTDFLHWKYDLSVFFRLKKQMRDTDAVVTVGAGDKMFWGRLAAKAAGVPVICSALHSTGWPDGVGRLNRWLTPLTTGFIACAKQHARHLVTYEKFPQERVHMIPNGVDVDRFCPTAHQRHDVGAELEIPRHCAVVGIIAALRKEKNHSQFLRSANRILHKRPDTHFLIVGDGPERAGIESQIRSLGIGNNMHLLGNRCDTERILAALDVFCLTSEMEANPVSILEALSCGVPVVAPDVGSISETVIHGETGFLTKPLCEISSSEAILQLLDKPAEASRMGQNGRELISGNWSLRHMVDGYETLLAQLYNEQRQKGGFPHWHRPAIGSESLGQSLLAEAQACHRQTQKDIAST